ncbi:MAG: non-homologous end-joining DNA ligase [Patescibacteria group bacterium]
MKFSNTEKIFWPKEKYTKGDVIAYYTKIAPVILPYLINRPMVLNRHPNGINGKSFYQKNVGRETLPAFVKTVAIRAETTGEIIRYVVCNNRETLLWLANFGCIEMNPWASSLKRLHKPDFLTIDIDPHGRPFDEVVIVAQKVHETLENLHMRSFCKTSGKTGMHVMIPLGAKYTYTQARDFARLLVARVHDELPKLTSIEQRIKKRRGKIYLDYMRNAFGQTVAAPYSLRPYPGATVSTPLRWSELKKGLRPGAFTIHTIFRRLAKRGDPLRPLLRGSADLKKAAQILERAH